MKYKLHLPIKWTKNAWSGLDQWPMVSPIIEDLEKYKVWCKENVGVNNWNFYGMYRKIPCELRFRYQVDLLAFMLTFGFDYDNLV